MNRAGSNFSEAKILVKGKCINNILLLKMFKFEDDTGAVFITSKKMEQNQS